MELDKIWLEIKDREQVGIPEKLTLREPGKVINPLRELRKNLLYNLGYGVAGIILGIYLMVQFPAASIQVTLGILIVKSLYFNWKMYQRIQALDRLAANWEKPIMESLQDQLTFTRQTIRMIEIRSMLFLPLAYLAGLLIGGSGDGVSADELIKDFTFLAKGMGLALLTMPFGYYLLKWMHKKSFGDHIEHIEEIISSGNDQV